MMNKLIPSFLLNKRPYPTFRYNGDAKYSVKDQKDKYKGNKFSVSNFIIELNKKRPSVKIQSLNIFKDHQIVAYSGHTAIGYDRWPLSNALWTKFNSGHGKCKSKISD